MIEAVFRLTLCSHPSSSTLARTSVSHENSDRRVTGSNRSKDNLDEINARLSEEP